MITHIELAVIILLLAHGPVTEYLQSRAVRLRKEREQSELAKEHAENEKMRAAIAREHHES